MNKQLSLEDLENLALGKIISLANRKQKHDITYLSFDEEALTFFNEENILLKEENRNKNYTPFFDPTQGNSTNHYFKNPMAQFMPEEKLPPLTALNSYQRLKKSDYEERSVKEFLSERNSSLLKLYQGIIDSLMTTAPEHPYEALVQWFKSYILQYYETPVENKHEILTVIKERMDELTQEQLQYLALSFMIYPYNPEYKDQ